MNRRMPFLLGWVLRPAPSTAGTSKEIQELADEMGFNGIASAAEVEALRSSSGDLAMLTDANAEKTMPWVQARLAAARGAKAKAELGDASEAQTGLVDQLEKLAKKMQRKASTSAA